MKKIFLLFLLIAQPAAFGFETGSANQIMRIPSGGGRGKYGSINLAQSAAVGSSILGVANGGSGAATLTGLLLGNGTSAFTALTSLAGTSYVKAPSFQSFIQSPYYTFTVTSTTFTAGWTYTNNSSTFTAVYANTVSGGTTFVAYRSAGTNAPSASGTLTCSTGCSSNITYSAVAANGTYFPTSSTVLWFHVRLAGGGGGGGGSGSASASAGGTGGTTTFGTTFLSAAGGTAGATGTRGTGAAQPTIPANVSGIALAGADGSGGVYSGQGTTPIQLSGSPGGATPLGGAGGGASYGPATGSAGLAGTGAGGGGASTGNANQWYAGGGGGSGGYYDVIVPVSTLSCSSGCAFNTGTSGSAGPAGTGGQIGGAGAIGGIFIEEHYQ